MLSGMTIFGGAAILGFLASFWGKLKAIFSRIISYLIVTVTVEGDAGEAVKIYLRTHYKKSPFGNKAFSSSSQYIKSEKRKLIIGYEIVKEIDAVQDR